MSLLICLVELTDFFTLDRLLIHYLGCFVLSLKHFRLQFVLFKFCMFISLCPLLVWLSPRLHGLTLKQSFKYYVCIINDQLF